MERGRSDGGEAREEKRGRRSEGRGGRGAREREQGKETKGRGAREGKQARRSDKVRSDKGGVMK